MKKAVILLLIVILATGVVAYAQRIQWTPDGFVILESKPSKSKLSAAEIERRRINEAEAMRQAQLRSQLKAQRKELQSYLQAGQLRGPCVMPCRIIPIPKETPPRIYPQLCARRSLSPYNFWLAGVNELCCCPR